MVGNVNSSFFFQNENRNIDYVVADDKMIFYYEVSNLKITVYMF